MQYSPLSDEDIKYIEQIARRAGEMALAMREGVNISTKTGPHDLVTDADLKISHMLIEALRSRFPHDEIVSEEDKHPVIVDEDKATPSARKRAWLIDPIDGTENYVKQDGQYSTMIGLLVDGVPVFGCIYQPSTETLFWGGAEYGAWKQKGKSTPERYQASEHLQKPIRLMFGWGERRKHPWVVQLPGVQFVNSDSLGLKIVKILEGDADVFLSVTGRVKLWDTAAPAAIAMGAKLEVGTANGDKLPYPLPHVQHGSSVIIGRPGSFSWAQEHDLVNRTEHEKTKSSR